MLNLRTPSVDDLEAIKRIYFEAFPPEEQRPWHLLLQSDGKPEFKAIYDGETLAGMVTYWNFDTFVYIEHLAIDPSLRGSGLGAQTLAYLRQELALPLLLEVEPPCPENSMAARRIGFYRRNGFEILPYDYIQPPYSPGLPSVPLLLMSTAALNPHLSAQTLHRQVYNHYK